MSKTVIAWVVVGIAVITSAVVVALWWAGTRGLDGQQLVTARLDALRTGLSIGLGGGGIFALYLAWRRQHSTEIGLVQKQHDQVDVARAYDLQRQIAAATERDAEARRITDLYTKAADQLGSDKAPVRLAGLYALERLAQDNSRQRQTIVNLLCAYLRMPYNPPGRELVDHADLDVSADAIQRERTLEREVRLTAQHILGHHLHPGDNPDAPIDTFWADIDINLTEAVLMDLSMPECIIRHGRFFRATFVGRANFSMVTFTGDARFGNATFIDDARFDDATFTGEAAFNDVVFTNKAFFGNVTFARDAFFNGATFTDEARFSDAIFASDALFVGATFIRRVALAGVTFTRKAYFDRVTFKYGMPKGFPDSFAAIE